MNPKERVLGKNGFEPFPKRLEKKAVEQGNKAPRPDEGIPEPLIPHGKQGKADFAKKVK